MATFVIGVVLVAISVLLVSLSYLRLELMTNNAIKLSEELEREMLDTRESTEKIISKVNEEMELLGQEMNDIKTRLEKLSADLSAVETRLVELEKAPAAGSYIV